MKLVHIADTHLGLAAFSRLDLDSGMNLREKQIYENFLAAIDVIVCERPDVLFCISAKLCVGSVTASRPGEPQKAIAAFFAPATYSSPSGKGRPVQARYFAGLIGLIFALF